MLVSLEGFHDTTIRDSIRKFLLSLIVAVVLFFVYNLDITRIWVVRHRSMLPTLVDGDIILSISTRIREPAVGDIVVARSLETGNIIKRVASIKLPRTEQSGIIYLETTRRNHSIQERQGCFLATLCVALSYGHTTVPANRKKAKFSSRGARS